MKTIEILPGVFVEVEEPSPVEKLVQIFMEDIAMATALARRFAAITAESQAGRISRDYGDGFAEAVHIVLAAKSTKDKAAYLAGHQDAEDGIPAGDGWIDYADGEGGRA